MRCLKARRVQALLNLDPLHVSVSMMIALRSRFNNRIMAGPRVGSCRYETIQLFIYSIYTKTLCVYVGC